MNFYPSCAQQGTGFSRMSLHSSGISLGITQNPLSISYSLVWNREFRGHWLPYEASIWSRLEKIFRICHLSVTKGTQTVAVGQSHTWVMGHFTPKAFPHWLPKYGEPGSASISGCGSPLSLTHPLETPTGEGRRLCDRNQEVTSSSLCRTLRGGVGKRSKCGWEVSLTTEGPAQQTLGFH